MNSVGIAFFLTIMAGLSTMLGVIPIFVNCKNEDKLIAGSLSFAGGVMICVSVVDLIPESISMLSCYNDFVMLFLIVIFMMIGVVISGSIDNVLSNKNNNSLYKVGIISMVAIVVHNIPEGIATFISTTKSFSLGLSLAIAIAFHNIPEGISISVPIYYSTNSKLKAIFYVFISALSEPLGALITYLFLYKYINNTVLGLLFSMIAGIMINISVTELLPASGRYNFSGLTRFMFLLGVFVMLLKFLF